MATIKSYSDLQQSKKLAEILPLESADMHYCLEKRDVATSYEIGTTSFIKAKRFEGKCNIIDVQPAWRLTALLGVLPEGTRLLKSTNISYVSDTKYHCGCYKNNIDNWFDNPVDACYEMIVKLSELKML